MLDLVEKSLECRLFQTRSLRGVSERGIKADPIFVDEIADRFQDTRQGITLVTRLTGKVVEQIRAVQLQLADFHPEVLIPYPQSAIHFTIQALGFDLSEPQLDQVGAAAFDALQEIEIQSFPTFYLRPSRVVLSSDSCGLHLDCVDDTLVQLRSAIFDALERRGFKAEFKRSVHINLLRFAKNTAVSLALIDFVEHFRPLPWSVAIDSAQLVRGYTRYGLPHRVKELGFWRLANALGQAS